MQLFFRNDDVNPSTKYDDLLRCYTVIKDLFPKAEIVSCITLFSKYNSKGSVYADVPFKNKPMDWFYCVDKFMVEWDYILHGLVASHGLFHVRHAELSKDAQKMSIISSCRFLKTNLFVPPFNNWNDDTINICDEYGINLFSNGKHWKNFEYEKFDSTYPYWYFHSWAWSPTRLKEALTHGINSQKNG